MKVLKSILVLSSSLLVLSLFLSGCEKGNNYLDYPQITFNSFTPFCSGSTTDSAYLDINFTDGNGEIGWPAQDASVSPDFYALEYIDSAGIFIPEIPPHVMDSVVYKYHIPDITPAGKDKSLNGIIQINLEGAFTNVLANFGPYNFHEVKFLVWIYDRNGNKSNLLLTPQLSICQ